jgi:hypothetical protein
LCTRAWHVGQHDLTTERCRAASKQRESDEVNKSPHQQKRHVRGQQGLAPIKGQCACMARSIRRSGMGQNAYLRQRIHEDASVCHHHALTIVFMSVDVFSGQQGPACASRRHLAVASTASCGGVVPEHTAGTDQQAPITVRHMYIASMSMRRMAMTLKGMGSRLRTSCTHVLAAVVATI